MTELFEVKEICKIVKPGKELNIYLVVAYWRGGWWKVFPNQYLNSENAKVKAESLHDGFGSRYVFRLNLGKEEAK